MASSAAVLRILVTASTTAANTQLAKTQAQLRATAATAESSAAKTAATWQSAGRRMQSVGRSMTTYISVPAAAVGAASVKMAMDFEDSMQQIHSSAGASQKEVSRLHDAVLELAKSGKTEFTPNELAQGLYHIESQGFRAADAMRVLKTASQGADIGNANLEDTSRALAAAMHGLGSSAKDSTKIMSQLNKIVGLGDMRMDDLAGAMSTGILASAKNLGIGLQDVGAALDVMTRSGMSATSSATRLRMTLSMMAAPTDAAKEALSSIGLSATDLATTMREKGLPAAVDQLAKALDGISKTKAQQVLSAAFGGGRTSAAIMTLVRSSSELRDVYSKLGPDVAGFHQKLRKDSQTTASRLHVMWARVSASLIQLGETLTPVVEDLAGVVGALATGFTKFPKFARTILIGAVVLGPFITGLGRIAAAWGAIRAAALGAAAAEGAAGAGAGAGAAGILGPLALGVAGGVGVYGAFKSKGGILDTIKGNATDTTMSLELVSKSLAAMREKFGSVSKAALHMSLYQRRQFIELAAVAKEQGNITASQFEHISDQMMVVSRSTIPLLIKRYGSLLNAAHHMSKGQREAYFDAAKAARASGEITGKEFRRLEHVLSFTEERWKKHMNEIAKQTGMSVKDVKKFFGDMNAKVTDSFDNMVKVSFAGMEMLVSSTNDLTGQLGMKRDIKFHANPRAMHGKPTGGGSAGIRAGAQQGGFIPGSGSGDKVPAMLEPGEFVMNREAVRGIGKARLEAMNKAIPRFAKGGMVLPKPIELLWQVPNHYDHLHAGFTDTATTIAAGKIMQRMGYSVGEGPGPFGPITPGVHVGGSLHYQNRAVDVNDDLAPFVRGGSETTSLSYLYGLLKSGKAGAAMLEKLKRIIIAGPKGALRNIAQGAVDRTWKAANAYLAGLSPRVTGSADIGKGVLSRGDMRKLLKAHGLPDIFGWIAEAESSLNPNAIGHDPGGTTGYGLWQITSGYNDALIRRFQPILDPNNNAAAAYVLSSGGSNTQPWAPSQSNWGTHIGQPYRRGGLVMPPYGGSFAGGGIVPGPIGAPRTVIAHGGEPVGAPNVNVNVSFANGMEWLRQFVRIEIEDDNHFRKQRERQDRA